MVKNDEILYLLIREIISQMEFEELQAKYPFSIKEALERFLEKHNGEYTPHYKFIDNTYEDYDGVVTKSRERTSFRCVIPNLVGEKMNAIQDYQYSNMEYGILPTSYTKLDYLDGHCSIGIEMALEDSLLRELIEDFIYDFFVDENTYPRIGYKRRVFFEDSEGQRIGKGLVIAIAPPNFLDSRPHLAICFVHED